MDHTYWHKQTAEQPLFPDLLWSRPEHKRQAGKLLVIGGNAYGFAAAGEAYSQATKAGIGTTRVLLPDSLQKTVGRVFEAGEYAPSTPSGSFSQKALAEVLAMSEWSDGTLLAGDLGRNSETAILLEQFMVKYTGRVTLTKDAADYFTKAPAALLSRPETVLVISFAQLQKLAASSRFPKAFTFDMDFLRLVDQLYEFTQQHQAYVIVKHLQTIFVAVNGQISTTKLAQDVDTWRVKTAAATATWWLQNPLKPFEALTTALISERPQN